MLVEEMTLAQARATCPKIPGCKGFTFREHGGFRPLPASNGDERFKVYFKNFWAIAPGDGWTSYRFEPATLWRYDPASPIKVPVSIQAAPSMEALKMETTLAPGEVFGVTEMVKDEQEVR